VAASEDAGRGVDPDLDTGDRPRLGDRLDLLERANQVTPLARALTDEAIARIEREFEVVLDEANAAQLVTHLAVALSRLDRDEALTETPAVVGDELAEYPRELAFVRELLADLGTQVGRRVPDAEVSYLTLHLCALTA
jgi:transcriptional regulatory protein LevR